jgi:hypothetical protein|tara:strand:- start:222 stop:1202 length:981 start_codon:yes stop_codon:yes gene_type:complete
MYPGAGIMALADYLDIPEMYESYGDTHLDRLTNPNMYLDPIKMGGNVISDIVSFVPDLAGDIPAAVIDRALHDPLFKEGLLTDYGDYLKDSVRSNALGIPYKIEDNPLNPKIAEGVNTDITKMVDDHYAKELKRIGDDDDDGYLDVAEEYATENTPSYAVWAYNNPEAEDDSAYNEMLNKNYMKKYEEIFPEDERRDFVEKTANSVYQTRYGINDPYLDQNQAIAGPGLREFDLKGINLPFTDKYDIPFQYGAEGDPIFKYATPEAKDTYTKLNIAGEIGVGIPAALKFLFKRGTKKAKSGAKDFRGDSGGFDYRDYMSDPKKFTR